MKVIKTEGYSKLVEYIDNDGNVKRCTLPIEIDDPQLGIQYGLPFENFVTHPEIGNEFRKRGIFTLEDLHKNHKVALGAIQAAYAQDLAMIKQLAAKEALNV